jgi:ABC-type microcin C transport system permease subunit YejE
MEVFLKMLATTVEYKAIAYDRSIILQPDGNYTFVLRVDDETLTFYGKSLKEAQDMMEMFESEVFEGPEVPWSVFCPGVNNESP